MDRRTFIMSALAASGAVLLPGAARARQGPVQDVGGDLVLHRGQQLEGRGLPMFVADDDGRPMDVHEIGFRVVAPGGDPSSTLSSYRPERVSEGTYATGWAMIVGPVDIRWGVEPPTMLVPQDAELGDYRVQWLIQTTPGGEVSVVEAHFRVEADPSSRALEADVALCTVPPVRAFRQGEETGRGDLTLHAIPRSDAKIREVTLKVFQGDDDEGLVLLTVGKRYPSNPAEGEYHPALRVPKGAQIGPYRLRWRIMTDDGRVIHTDHRFWVTRGLTA